MAISPLTLKQAAVLIFIAGAIERDGAAPSLDDIAHDFGISRPTVHEHVRALKRKGYVNVVPRSARGITLTAAGRRSAPEQTVTCPSCGHEFTRAARKYAGE